MRSASEASDTCKLPVSDNKWWIRPKLTSYTSSNGRIYFPLNISSPRLYHTNRNIVLTCCLCWKTHTKNIYMFSKDCSLKVYKFTKLHLRPSISRFMYTASAKVKLGQFLYSQRSIAIGQLPSYQAIAAHSGPIMVTMSYLIDAAPEYVRYTNMNVIVQRGLPAGSIAQLRRANS